MLEKQIVSIEEELQSTIQTYTTILAQTQSHKENSNVKYKLLENINKTIDESAKIKSLNKVISDFENTVEKLKKDNE